MFWVSSWLHRDTIDNIISCATMSLISSYFFDERSESFGDCCRVRGQSNIASDRDCFEGSGLLELMKTAADAGLDPSIQKNVTEMLNVGAQRPENSPDSD